MFKTDTPDDADRDALLERPTADWIEQMYHIQGDDHIAARTPDDVSCVAWVLSLLKETRYVPSKGQVSNTLYDLLASFDHMKEVQEYFIQAFRSWDSPIASQYWWVPGYKALMSNPVLCLSVLFNDYNLDEAEFQKWLVEVLQTGYRFTPV